MFKPEIFRGVLPFEFGHNNDLIQLIKQKAKTEVVFSGYGICAPQKGRDDYAGVDVTGKAVLIYRDIPKDGQDWSKENGRDYKVNTAAS